MKRFLLVLSLAAAAAASLQVATAPIASPAAAAATSVAFPQSVYNRSPQHNFEWPWWVISKEGQPILLEADFAGPFPSTRWGTVTSGAGSVTADTACNETTDPVVSSTAPCLFYGGKGSARLLAPATAGVGSEIKTTILNVIQPGDLVSFEGKLAEHFGQSTTDMQVGLEYRKKNAVDGIHQARFLANCNGGTYCTWKLETSVDVYSLFSTLAGSPPSAIMETPLISGASGTPVGWFRIVVDPWNDSYYSFTIPYTDITTGVAFTYTWDLRSVPLIHNGAASKALILPFAYCINHSTSAAEVMFTTDWAMAILPRGWPEGRFPANFYGGVLVQPAPAALAALYAGPRRFHLASVIRSQLERPGPTDGWLGGHPDELGLPAFGQRRRRGALIWN